MREDVLAITGAVLQTANQASDFVREASNADMIRGLLPFAENSLVHLAFCFLDELLDVRRVNASINNQPFQSNPRYFPSNRVKRGQGDGFRRIIDQEVHAGQGLESPDVPAFPANDAPLPVFGGERNHADRRFTHVSSRNLLDRRSNDLSCLGISLKLSIVHDLAYHLGDTGPRVLFGSVQNNRPGLVGIQLRDALQFSFRSNSLTLEDLRLAAKLLLHCVEIPVFLLYLLDAMVKKGLFLDPVSYTHLRAPETRHDL